MIRPPPRSTLFPYTTLFRSSVPLVRLLYLRNTNPAADLTITVTGRMWYWTYDYSGHGNFSFAAPMLPDSAGKRSEEHTSELQSPCNLVCRLLLEKKKQVSYPSNFFTAACIQVLSRTSVTMETPTEYSSSERDSSRYSCDIFLRYVSTRPIPFCFF